MSSLQGGWHRVRRLGTQTTREARCVITRSRLRTIELRCYFVCADPSDPGDRPTKRRRSTSAASLLPASSSVSASTTAHPPPQPSTSRVQVSLTTKSPPSTRRGWPDKSSAPRNGDFVALSPNAPLVSPLDLLNTSTGHGHAVSPLGSSSALSEAASPASAVFTDPPSLSSQHDPLLLGVLSEQRARELHLL